jgi:hypothetical protein
VHPDPQDFEILQVRAGTLLGGGTAEEHVVEMIRAPAWAMAATPAIQTASLSRNPSLTATSPCWPNEIPEPESSSDGGSASTRSSTPSLIHGRGRMTCRQRAIPVFPELGPPLSTMT